MTVTWRAAELGWADGDQARAVLVDATTAERVLARACQASGAWVQRPRRGPARDLWAVVKVGLLFDIGG